MSDKLKKKYYQVPKPVTLMHAQKRKPLRDQEVVLDDNGVVTGARLVDAKPWDIYWTLHAYVFSGQIALDDKEKGGRVLDWKTGRTRMKAAHRIEVALRDAEPGDIVVFFRDDWQLVKDWFDHPKFCIPDSPQNIQLQGLIDTWDEATDELPVATDLPVLVGT